jgi:hypothetical protein
MIKRRHDALVPHPVYEDNGTTSFEDIFKFLLAEPMDEEIILILRGAPYVFENKQDRVMFVAGMELAACVIPTTSQG